MAELDKLAPEAGEEAILDASRRMMQSAEKIRGDVVNAYEAMGQSGAEAQMADALRWLDVRLREQTARWKSLWRR